MAAPSWRCLTPEDGELNPHGQYDGSFGQQNGGTNQEERGLSFLLKQEDREIQDSYLQLFNKLDIAVKEMKQYVIQINKWVERPLCVLCLCSWGYFLKKGDTIWQNGNMQPQKVCSVSISTNCNTLVCTCTSSHCTTAFCWMEKAGPAHSHLHNELL